MIKAKNVVKTYTMGDNKITVLNNLSLFINKGEFVAITGRSGAGKSTLLYQLGLLDTPDSGKIILDNFDTSQLNEKKRAQFRLEFMGYVFQDFALLPELTALETVALPLIMMGESKINAYKQANDSLKKVGLGERPDNTPGQLSGGQQQRVAIARAIVNNPKILFADEPTASLDSNTAQTIIKLFKTLNKEGQTIVMITHEDIYAKQAKRIIELDDGKIVKDYNL